MPKTDRVVEDLLAESLAEPMTAAQRASMDARLQPMLTRSSRLFGLPRRPAVRRSLVLVALVLVALPLAALGGMFSTEDPFGLATPEEFQAELDVAMAEVPLPAGRTWPDLPSLNAHQPGVGGYSRGGGSSQVEILAVCIWLDEWVDAHAADDGARLEAATTEIQAIRTWPSWDSPFWHQSVRDYLNPIIDAAAAGNREPVAAEVASDNCSWMHGAP